MLLRRTSPLLPRRERGRFCLRPTSSFDNWAEQDPSPAPRRRGSVCQNYCSLHDLRKLPARMKYFHANC